jgi:tetratricopeptide (TPR) repeat protein
MGAAYTIARSVSQNEIARGKLTSMSKNFTSSVEGFESPKSPFEEKIETLVEPTLFCFQKIAKKYFYFHLAFLALISVEALSLLLFFSPLAETHFIGIVLALTFFTVLLYFILQTYFQEQKPEELQSLRNEYINACKEFIDYENGSYKHHLALAKACCYMKEHLEGKERIFYELPKGFEALKKPIERASSRFHWADTHAMKELFLLASIDEHIKLIQNQPTSLEAHAATANAYVMLSHLYVDPSSQDTTKRWQFSQKKLNALKTKHRVTIERALEEFKILSDYAPSDPWVHEMLALSFHELGMTKQEIQEYETILSLQPDQLDALFKLGVLYFQEGENAKGLKVYEQLKAIDSEKAGNLIQYYGAYTLR